jgi:hypothetical protein
VKANNEEILASYGKVSAEVYAERAKEIVTLPEVPTPSSIGGELESTLREDYEAVTDCDGTFFVYYLASCVKCGFGHEFNHKEDLKVGA